MTVARKVIILGAGPPYRGREPSLLSETENHWSVLDWLSNAFSETCNDIHLVGGYRVKDIVRRYPKLSVSVNLEWRETGPVESLFTAPLEDGFEYFVCYSDTVFSKNAVTRLANAEGDVLLAADSAWRRRYANRSQSDLNSAEKIIAEGGRVRTVGQDVEHVASCAEFTGLLRFSPRAASRLVELRSARRDQFLKATMPTLLQSLIEDGLDVRWVDIDGDWAELNAPTDLARFVLGTKAETLERLRPMVAKSRIGEQVSLTLGEWRKHERACLDRIIAQFPRNDVIVRSSASNEDGWNTANAGVFLSIPNIACSNNAALAEAIDRVFGSYRDEATHNQVLIQQMIDDVAISGVVFSRTLTFGGPYYSINYDEQSARSDTVTAGVATELKTLLVFRDCDRFPDATNPLLGGLLPAVRELESLVAHDTLDIEFIIGSDRTVHIVQIRPITVDHSRWRGGSDQQVAKLISDSEAKFAELTPPGPFMLGQAPIFSNMSDWNPAEIIGTRPRPLAASLYRLLVTDEVWARQRSEYGYRDVRPQRLMVFFAGQPYIDVRASFVSFIPAALDNTLAERLAEHYLERLRSNPSLHDKVEFDVLFTCTTLDFDSATARLKDAGFSRSEISELAAALRTITNRGFLRVNGDLAAIAVLNRRRERINASALTHLDRALALLEDCRRFGSLPFAHLARAGFVAASLLRSAVARELMDAGTLNAFLASVETVASRFGSDAIEVATGKRDWEQFVDNYGHLRPGTYEITSPRYRSAPDRFLRPLVKKSSAPAHESLSWRWPKDISASLETVMAENGLSVNAAAFDTFARAAIQGREYAKFCFTSNLSDAIESIAEFGASIDLDRELLSYIEIEDLMSFAGAAAPIDAAGWLKDRAYQNRELHTLAHGVELPPLIAQAMDFRTFHYPETHPNFVNAGIVSAEAVRLDSGGDKSAELAGKIVLIPQADPGYDWLFGHAIGGLITAYGGANSHMAIRAAEFGLPAAIGVGEKYYERLTEAQVISLDCQNRRIEIVR